MLVLRLALCGTISENQRVLAEGGSLIFGLVCTKSSADKQLHHLRPQPPSISRASASRTEAAGRSGASALRLKTIFFVLHHRKAAAPLPEQEAQRHLAGIFVSRSSVHHSANTLRRDMLPSLTPQGNDGAVWLDG